MPDVVFLRPRRPMPTAEVDALADQVRAEIIACAEKGVPAVFVLDGDEFHVHIARGDARVRIEADDRVAVSVPA